jgi:hypothetical protein
LAAWNFSSQKSSSPFLAWASTPSKEHPIYSSHKSAQLLANKKRIFFTKFLKFISRWRQESNTAWMMYILFFWPISIYNLFFLTHM